MTWNSRTPARRKETTIRSKASGVAQGSSGFQSTSERRWVATSPLAKAIKLLVLLVHPLDDFVERAVAEGEGVPAVSAFGGQVPHGGRLPTKRDRWPRPLHGRG
jgi:hypothetical protein